MVRIVRSLLRRAYFVSAGTTVMATLRTALRGIHAEWVEERRAARHRVTSKLDPPLTVAGGPFKGLRYPDHQSTGSANTPILIGTYEKELHETLERCIAKSPPLVLDLGCAEGYYAVGMALRCPQARVIGFDIDPAAATAFDALRCLNGVADRTTFGGECTPEQLLGHTRGKRGVIISDIEGSEFELFTSVEPKSLRDWDLIIELHDSAERRISGPLLRHFLESHSVSVVRHRKRALRDFPPFDGLVARFDKLACMDEERSWRACWLVCHSRYASLNTTHS